MKKEDLEEVKKQIEIYKKWRDVLQTGDFYRGRTGDNITEWTVVSKDKTSAVGMIFSKLVTPNSPHEMYYPMGLEEGTKYHLYNRELKYNVKEFGDLVNTVAPIHIKQDGILHNLVSKVVKMDGEKEDVTAYGSTLMNAGVHLKQGFAATGYNGEVRHFTDFSSRVYFMEKVNTRNNGENDIQSSIEN